MKKRKVYSVEFKTKVVLEALKEEDSLSSIASKYEITVQTLRKCNISIWFKQCYKRIQRENWKVRKRKRGVGKNAWKNHNREGLGKKAWTYLKE